MIFLYCNRFFAAAHPVFCKSSAGDGKKAARNFSQRLMYTLFYITSWYTSTISGMVTAAASVVITLIAPAYSG